MEEIRPGELCPSCGEVTLDAEEGEQVECPNCGEIVVISGDWVD